MAAPFAEALDGTTKEPTKVCSAINEIPRTHVVSADQKKAAFFIDEEHGLETFAPFSAKEIWW